jgi:mono/diheme cytochrome c family protein
MFAVVALFLVTETTAADVPNFSTDIAPMLATKCSKCHGATRQKNDLRLDSAEAVQKGGKNGPIFVAGKPDQSPMWVRATKPPGDADRMPAEGQMLTKKQTDLLKAWIAAGAKFD